jgi:ferredoxin-NADP reductase
MLKEETTGQAMRGNTGLANEAQAPAWPGFKQMRIKNILRESDSVTSFVFVPIDGQPLPVFQPGQFVVLRLHVDPSKPPVLRSYSLSDLPDVGHFRISVKKESNGIGSLFLYNRVREGDLLDVSAPRGSFTLCAGNGSVVLLSAGIGATPVLSMLHALAAEGSKRHVWWVYAARNRASHPFAEESRLLLKRLTRKGSCIVYSRPVATDQLGTDFDVAGHIDTALLKKLGVLPDSDFYLCGPSSFLRNMHDGLRDWGVAAEQVHTEVFGALEGITPGLERVDRTPHQPQGPPGSGPSVSFARSGITVEWDRRFDSLLALAEACDVPVRWSCRTGVCHTCITGLIGGSVAYHPEPLERPTPGNVLVCCSQPEVNITLDL